MDYESGFFAQLYGLSIRFGRIALGNVRTHVLSSEEKLLTILKLCCIVNISVYMRVKVEQIYFILINIYGKSKYCGRFFS